MAGPIQLRNRLEIRQPIGYNLQDIIVGTATGGGDTSSLLDTYAFAKFNDDDLNGRQVMFNSGTTVAVGDKSFVSDYAVATFDCTLAPVVSGAVAAADTYEMWRVFTVEEVNDAINQAIISITQRCLQHRQTATNFTLNDIYEYACLTSFEGLYKVEYCASAEVQKEIDNCDD